MILLIIIKFIINDDHRHWVIWTPWGHWGHWGPAPRASLTASILASVDAPPGRSSWRTSCLIPPASCLWDWLTCPLSPSGSITSLLLILTNQIAKTVRAIGQSYDVIRLVIMFFTTKWKLFNSLLYFTSLKSNIMNCEKSNIIKVNFTFLSLKCYKSQIMTKKK